MKADNVFGKRLLQSLGIDETALAVPTTPVSFAEHVQSYDCVIGARLHACIVSYAMDVPVVGLIWNDKTKFFAEITDRLQFYFDEAHLDANAIADAVEHCMETPYDINIRDQLRQKTLHYLSLFVKTYIGVADNDDLKGEK